MKDRFLLVTFCNQTESPRQSAALFALDTDGCAWLEQVFPEVLEPGSAGLCGACRIGSDLVFATQSPTPSLILYDPTSAHVKATRNLPACRDLHSIAYHDGVLYVVSTGTNEIHAVPLGNDAFGTPRLYWRYPGVEYDRDCIHLNGLTVSPDGLIASCFGPPEPNGNWGGSEGTIFRVDPFQVIQDGLSQPHTPLSVGNRLFFAESRLHLVHELRRQEAGTWCAERPIHVGGYTRGLACQGDLLWVGISTRRRISRSKGTPNPGIEADHDAALVGIDLNTRTVTHRRELSGLGNEIYDILNLDAAEPVGNTLDALTQRILGMQERIETMTLDTQQGQQAQQAEQAQQAQQAQLAYEHALQAERAYSDQLAEQLRMIAGSRLWRTTQLLRRMIGRAPQVLDLRRPLKPSDGTNPLC